MSGTEAGLLGIYNFPGSVYATDGSKDKGVMGAGFFKLDEHRRGCCKTGVCGYEQDAGYYNAFLINSHARYNSNNGVY